MEHKPLSDLSRVADLAPENAPMTRCERLDRWIEVLEREPGRALKTLHEIEYKPPQVRRASRVDNSPPSLAFNDPILRADGLASDRLGDVVDYFELSDEEAHRAFCSCFYGESMTASAVAARLRSISKPAIGVPVAIWGVGAVLVALPFITRMLL